MCDFAHLSMLIILFRSISSFVKLCLYVLGAVVRDTCTRKCSVYFLNLFSLSDRALVAVTDSDTLHKQLMQQIREADEQFRHQEREALKVGRQSVKTTCKCKCF